MYLKNLKPNIDFYLENVHSNIKPHITSIKISLHHLQVNRITYENHIKKNSQLNLPTSWQFLSL